ncbi:MULTISPECIES: hypothetical protein [Microbacterium]|uniref:Uncharacterized protein n=1 Tax=Microbacterium hominis TaxID=162426 RepID=A0A2K9DSH1_9MICO|nr:MULTISPECIES: hypothetical protein [Microbacterium]AUG28774.1 hypothetical protein CXR34_04325 [Microbacterium hominis]
MAWFKVDDQLHSHPKAGRAGLAAMGLWALAGSHCMSYLTDGVVERWFVESKPNGVKLAAALVKAGLWDEHEDGWVFHDWDEFQPTSEKVLEDRADARERMRKVRANKKANVQPNEPEVSPMTDLLARQAGITSLQAIIDAAEKHTNRKIDASGAYRVAKQLLGKAKVFPQSPQRYVTGSISRSSLEVQQFIDEQCLAVTP